MEYRNEVTLSPGVGIVEDRYGQKRGTYSVLPEPGRQVTLISADAVEEVMKQNNFNVPVGNLRRNVILRGISRDSLNSWVGREILLGDCLVFAHRLTVPCMYNERKNNCDGLRAAIWHLGGISCEVLQGGCLRVGQQVQIKHPDRAPELARCNDGGKKPSFYKHPFLRTAAEAKECAGIPKEGGVFLSSKDPEGVWRLQSAWESVGLSIFEGGMPRDARNPNARFLLRSFFGIVIQLLTVFFL